MLKFDSKIVRYLEICLDLELWSFCKFNVTVRKMVHLFLSMVLYFFSVGNEFLSSCTWYILSFIYLYRGKKRITITPPPPPYSNEKSHANKTLNIFLIFVLTMQLVILKFPHAPTCAMQLHISDN